MGTGNPLSRLSALVKLHRNLLGSSDHVKGCLQDLLAFCPTLPGPVLDSQSRHFRVKGLFSLQSEGEQSKLYFLSDQVATILLTFFMTPWFFLNSHQSVAHSQRRPQVWQLLTLVCEGLLTLWAQCRCNSEMFCRPVLTATFRVSRETSFSPFFHLCLPCICAL